MFVFVVMFCFIVIVWRVCFDLERGRDGSSQCNCTCTDASFDVDVCMMLCVCVLTGPKGRQSECIDLQWRWQ